MLINAPQLPPKEGYYEDVDPESGERIYIKTDEQIEKENLIDTISMLEDCIAEMAEKLYA